MIFAKRKRQGQIKGDGWCGNHHGIETGAKWLDFKVLKGGAMTRMQLRDNVCRAFCAAVLLSGDMAIAEEAVHEAILSLDIEDLSTEALFICVATLSIQRSYGLATAGNQGLIKLPQELLHVLQLPRISRQCFVLRFLLSLPEGICASLLHMDRNEICDATCVALSELAAAGEQRIGSLVCVPIT